MKNILFTLLAGALLSGCASTPVSQAPEPTGTETIPPIPTWTSTSEPTNTMTPTATATMVPLSQIDWNAIIYQGGDLPGTFAVSDIERLGTGAEYSVPPADAQSKMTFWIPGTDDVISVIVFIYDSLETVDAAYQTFRGGAEAGAGIGEKSFLIDHSEPEGTYSVFLSAIGFTRCHALASLSMASIGWSDPSILADYAKKLDARLGEAACR